MLSIEALSVADNVGQLAVDHLSLAIRAGEIVGVAGVSGNGQRELVETLAGQRHAESGRMLVHGEIYSATRPEMIRQAYLREIGKFCQQMQLGCENNRCDYFLMDTSRPVGTTLSAYLCRRLQQRLI